MVLASSSQFQTRAPPPSIFNASTSTTVFHLLQRKHRHHIPAVFHRNHQHLCRCGLQAPAPPSSILDANTSTRKKSFWSVMPWI